MTKPHRRTLLLGAGFSYDLGMPLAAELTQLLLNPFNWLSTRSLAKSLSQKDPYSAGRPINHPATAEALQLVRRFKRSGRSNYEEMLAEIEGLGERPKCSQSDRDSYHYVFGFLYELVYAVLYAYQEDAYRTLYSLNRPHFGAIANLLADHPTWVFSLNHDVFLECLAIDEGIPITYGDTDSIKFPLSNESPDTITLRTSTPQHFSLANTGWLRSGVGINCVRLHGGLAELEYKDRSIICNPSLKWATSEELLAEVSKIDRMAYYQNGVMVPSSRDRVVTGPDGELDIVVRTMRTGGKKYSKTTNPKKGEERLALFADALLETDELLIIGYSFGDAHINYRISNAMVLNPGMKVVSVDPKGQRCPAFLAQFDYDQRVRAAYCRAVEWMYYLPTETWNTSASHELREREQLRQQIKDRVRANWLRARLLGRRPA